MTNAPESEEQRARRDHDCGYRSRERAELTPAEDVDEADHDDGRECRRQTGGPFVVAQKRKRDRDQLEEEAGLVEVCKSVVTGDEPCPAFLHFPGNLGVSPLVRPIERRVTQANEEHDAHVDSRKGRHQHRSPLLRAGRGRRGALVTMRLGHDAFSGGGSKRVGDRHRR